MADEGMDGDTFDGEIVQGAGGYVDDDLDLDDDDEDEPLLGNAPRATASASPRLPKVPRSKQETPSHATEAKRRKTDADPDDFLLRASGTNDLRDYIVAKFVTRTPDITDKSHVRLYRKTEGTARGRERGIQADRRQKIYYNTFSGKQRLARYAKQGIVTIPDRYRKGWAMEISSTHDESRPPPPPQLAKSASGGDDNLTVNPVAHRDKPSTDPNTDVFAGTFDGKTTSRYAFMVLSEGSKTVDVVPIDEFAWFSFRTNRSQGGDSVELEAQMTKNAKKGQSRMSKFQVKYEEAQGIREQNMGDNTRIQNSKDFATVGIRRNRAKQDPDEEAGGESMDFDIEFDNDDVAQVDRETVEKAETRILGDAEQNAKDFRKMIKDEPISSRPASPGSESDEDPAQRRSPPSASRSPSPSRPLPASRSPNRSTMSSPKPVSRLQTPMGASPSGSTVFGVSPSQGSPRGNTPQKLDLSHLLPPSGTLPKAQHAVAVLTALLKNSRRIALKDALQYFERRTKEQKANLRKVLREVTVVVEEPKSSKNYFISLKASAVPSGLPSGR